MFAKPRKTAPHLLLIILDVDDGHEGQSVEDASDERSDEGTAKKEGGRVDTR